MSTSGSASGAQPKGSPRRGEASGAAGTGRSRSGSASGLGGQAQRFDRSTYPLRDKEGISKRLDLPAEAYYHVSLTASVECDLC